MSVYIHTRVYIYIYIRISVCYVWHVMMWMMLLVWHDMCRALAARQSMVVSFTLTLTALWMQPCNNGNKNAYIENIYIYKVNTNKLHSIFANNIRDNTKYWRRSYWSPWSRRLIVLFWYWGLKKTETSSTKLTKIKSNKSKIIWFC